MPYPGITKEACELAFVIMGASLAAAADNDVANKMAGTLVIINPFYVPSSNEPMHVSVEEARDAALFMRRVDDDHPQAEKYDEIALTKARDMWVLRSLLGPNFTGRDIQQQFPHLYRPGMTKWHGGVCRFGVPYAFSGVQGNYDEALANTAANWVEAMGRQVMVDQPGGVMASDDSFIGRPDRQTADDLGRTALHSVYGGESSAERSGERRG